MRSNILDYTAYTHINIKYDIAMYAVKFDKTNIHDGLNQCYYTHLTTKQMLNLLIM